MSHTAKRPHEGADEATSVKRSRNEDAGLNDPSTGPAVPIPCEAAMPDLNVLCDTIDRIPPEPLKQLFKALLQSSPEARQMIGKCYNAYKPKDIDFSSSSKDVWYTLNHAYKSSRGSVEYNNAWNAVADVNKSIDHIKKHAGPLSTFRTRQNALQILRKIGKSIILAPSTLGHEVRKQMEWDQNLVPTMLAIADSLSFEERLTVGNSRDEKGSLVEKMKDLASDADDHCIFDGLWDVVDLLEYGDYEENEGSEVADANDDGVGESESEDDY